MGGASTLTGPDFTQGVPFASLKEGEPLAGQAHGEAVMLVRSGGQVHALGANCSHYGGPLAEGLVVDGTVRCPWHHACFDLKTGEAIGGPALNDVACFDVERRGDLVVLGARRTPPRRKPATSGPRNVVVIGAGAAGEAAVEMLRREGHDGAIALVGEEDPVDRPNLSKDYLAGNAPEEWIPLRPPDHHASLRVERVREQVSAFDVAARTVSLASGRSLSWDALLIATGAEPVRPPIEGVNGPNVFTLRTHADARHLIERSASARRVVVVGASFIGLEVAASLRARNVEVHVVAPETLPLARVLGDDLGRFIHALHVSKGVQFHLGRKPARIDAGRVTLDDGMQLEADFVVLGVGVRPRTQLAERAGLKVDNGILVDAKLRASADGVYAAGDVARYPDAAGSGLLRVEHWVAAERQGQAAARSMLGLLDAFRTPPFFWSAHYDTVISYVGSGAGFDRAEVRGEPSSGNAAVLYSRAGKPIALATIGRDRMSLEAEVAIERDGMEGLARLWSRDRDL